jgi:hypothetical protein
MAIEAQLADGRILEFPDGTDPAVIQSTVKRMIGVSQPEPSPTPTPTPAPTPKPAPTAPKPAQVAPDADYDFGDAMETGLDQIALGKPTPKKKSVLEGMQMPAPAPTEDKYVVNPEFTNAIQARLNALPEDQREAALDKMTKRPDVYGRAARAIAGRYEAQNKVTLPTATKLTDMRLEQQTQRFIDQGAAPEVAEGLARNQALSGQSRPDLDQMRETPQEVQAGMDLAYDPKLSGIDATIQAAKRVGLKTAMALGQAGGGMQVFAGDLLGIDTSDKQETLRKMNSFTQAMGDPSLKPLSILENAVTSIGQQLPAMVIGTVTGSEPLVLASMFANSFGQNYEESRRGKLDVADSTARAAANAALEIIGERFGLTQQIGAIKTAAKGVPTNELANFISITLKKEIPGELLTYAGQYAVDMGYGMKPEASIKNFVQGAIDTMLTTVAQGGIMAGGRKALSVAVRKSGAKTTPEITRPETIKSAEELAKSKGFLVQMPTKTEETETKTEATKPAGEPAAPANITSISERLQAQGIPQHIADAIADREVKANELARTEAEESGAASTAESISAPSGESVSVAGQPSAESPAAGAGDVDTSGVVSTGQTTTAATSGETVQPAPLNTATQDTPFVMRSANEQEQRITSSAVVTLPLPGGAKAIFTQNGDGDIELIAPNGKADKVVRAHDTREGAVRSLEDFPDYVPEPLRQLMLDYQQAAREQYYAEGDSKETAQQRLSEIQNKITDTVTSLETPTGTPAPAATEEALTETKSQPYTLTRGAVTPDTIRALSDEQLGTELTNTSLSDAEYNLVKTEITQRQEAPAEIPAEETVLWQGNPVKVIGKPNVESDGISYTRVKFQNAAGTFEGEGATDHYVPTEELGTEAPPKTKGTTSGTETSEAVEATQEGQTAPAAGAVTKGKRGRPPAQQRHVVTENPEGGFDHVTDGEVTATYKNRKQAVAAINLAKAKDRGDTARVTQYQAELDKALASQGRGRPAKVVTEEGAEQLSHDDQVELDALESALEAYNSPGNKDKIQGAAEYINDAANDKTAPEVVRKRAKQMLEEDVDPKDIPKKLRSSEANVDKADTGFSKLTTGAQAVNQIVKTGNLFQRFLAQRLRGYMAGVKFVVVEKGDNIPAEMEGARGLFEYTPGTKERTIYVRGASFGSQQGINNTTVLHELLHAATAGRISAGLRGGSRNPQLNKFVGELNSLMQRAREAYEEGVYLKDLPRDIQRMIEDTTEINPKTKKPVITVFADPNEFLAYGMSNPAFQKFLMSVEGTQKNETAFSKFVRSILDLFGLGKGNFTALSDLVNITDKMLNEEAAPTTPQGKTSLQQKVPLTRAEQQKELNRAVNTATKKVATSRAGNELGSATADLAKWRDPRYLWGEVKGIFNVANYDLKSRMSHFYDSEALAYGGPGETISGLRDAHEAIQKMSATTQTYLRGVANMSRDVVEFFRKNPKLRQPFEDLINTSTLAKYDPSDTSQAIRNKQLDADFKALGNEGQRVFRQLRDYYKALNDVKQYLLEQNLSKLGLEPEARKKLLADIRLIFEQDKIEPFFPLARFGDFVLEVGKRGSHASYRFETMMERDRAAREHAAKQGKSVDELRHDGELRTSEDSGGSALRSTIEGTSKLLKSAYAAIESSDMTDTKAKQNLKDALYQSYLAAMPENSVRKMFIHRKGTPGFSSDILRTINSTGLKMSRALAKLEHANDIRSALDLANRQLEGNDAYKPFVKRMEELAADALQPNVPTDAEKWFESAAGLVAKWSFLRNLTSWSSAMLQPMDIILVGAPVLTGNHGPKAVIALANRLKLTSQYGVVETAANGKKYLHAPSVEYSKGLTPLQRRAVRDMVDLYGVTKNTLSSEVMNRAAKANTRVDSKAYEVGKDAVNTLVLGGLMHHGERLSREVIALTSFDLYMAELQKANPGNPMNYHEAVKLAVRETHEALGNYDPTNRPLVMRGGFGRLITMYKFFPLVRTKLLGINFFKMIPFLNKEGKKEAATKFFGIMGTHLFFGGYTALPMFSLVMGILGLFWKKWQKDPDAPDDMKSVDYETWFRTDYVPNKIGDTNLSRLAEYGVANYLTGWNVSSRITMDDMWFRDPQPGKTLKDTFLNWGQVIGGPAVSNMLATAQGLQLMSQGEYERGLEKVMPIGSISKLMTALRYADEGVQTPQGVQLVEKGKVPKSELVGQAIGFAPARIAEAQDKSFKESAAEKVVASERAAIVGTLKDSFRKSMDINRTVEQNERFSKIFDDTLDKMIDFNIRNPNNPINMNEVGAMIKDSLKKITEAELGGGVRVTKKNYELAGPSSEAAQRALDPYNK